MRSQTLAGLMIALSLGGCAAGPTYVAPSARTLGVPDRLPSQAATPAGDDVSLSRWWTQFNDPVLTDLVERALAANTSLAAAKANVAQARAQLRGAGANLFPDLTAQVGHTNTAGVTSASLIGSASWEIDLFGGTRRSVEASRDSLGGVEAQLNNTRIEIAGEVARAYIDARLTQARLAVAEANLKVLRESLQVSQWRATAGLVETIDVEQTRQLVAQTESSLPTLRTNLRSDLNQLAVLCGTAPGTVDGAVTETGTIPTFTGTIPDLVPADIVRRRPDVANAERALASATAQIGVAEAKLLPSLALGGTLTGEGARFSGLTDHMISVVTATVAQTLFDGGRTQAQVDAQKAATDAALASYRGTVLNALEDADNAYQALDGAKDTLAAATTSETAARTAATFRRQQYKSGLVDVTTLIEAERTQLSSSDSALQARAQTAQAAVTLIQALGGDSTGAANPLSE
jgi:NodT family efflux transporter outer membrane factor (OMF) lipoprotein